MVYSQRRRRQSCKSEERKKREETAESLDSTCGERTHSPRQPRAISQPAQSILRSEGEIRSGDDDMGWSRVKRIQIQ